MTEKIFTQLAINVYQHRSRIPETTIYQLRNSMTPLSWIYERVCQRTTKPSRTPRDPRGKKIREEVVVESVLDKCKTELITYYTELTELGRKIEAERKEKISLYIGLLRD